MAETVDYDNRMRVNSYAAKTSASTAYSYALTYWPNGNVHTASDPVNGDWTYTYDTLNRVSTASSSATGLSWGYDAFGNRKTQTATKSSAPQPSYAFSTSNRIGGFCYDDAGNLLDEGPCPAGSTHQYAYDGEGSRIAKSSSSAVTEVYFYDVAGNRVVDTDGSLNPLRSEIYASGRHLASYNGNSSDIYYNHANWLGTKTVRTDSAGDVYQTLSGLPFGDGQQTSGSCSPTPSFYTGKERDAESGNDYFGARYYGSSMGRFMSPDPTFLNIRKVFNPQRWNLYSYSLNDPLGHFDPDGEEAIAVTYPGYQVGVRGSFTLPLGHGGVVLVEKDGTTHYFEYGRYHGPDGEVRNAGASDAATPPVQRDASGNITQDSMNNLLQTLSGASGKGGPVDALVIPTTSAEDENILTYLKARQAQNSDPNTEKYSLFGGHNCGTLACEALGHAHMNAPTRAWMKGATPYGNFLQLWALYGNSFAWEYQPKEHVTHRIFFPEGSN